MTNLSEFLLDSDIHFYRNYAIPIIKRNACAFDLDSFESVITENQAIKEERSLDEAYQEFLRDKQAQYEMHPKYGRYVWDIADQWYQKWNVVFSVEHMWNWIEHGVQSNQTIPKEHSFDTEYILPWLNHVRSKYNVHPDHQNLLYDICRYIGHWHQSNRSLTLQGTFKINTLPFFPPSWFTHKSRQNINTTKGLSPSYLAYFVPPYKPTQSAIPERWDQVFLKGLTVDPNHKFNLDPILIASAIPIFGLTVDLDPTTGYSKLMVVMPKAKYGNLEDQIEREIPTDYTKPCQLALSITKDIKDLHWNYIHGNIHPRNILLSNADYMGELVDITFMQRNNEHASHHLCGRWPYVAPEVVSTGLTAAADIYSLGIILWQLISRVTFPSDALVDPFVYRIEPIPHVLKEWEDIYSDCLNLDPTKRPNAYTIYRRLQTLSSHLSEQHTSMAQETLDYVKMRKDEIQEFLAHSRKSSPSTSSLDDGDTLCQVGNHVLTASITRPSHQRLKSYPNLIQKFP